MTRVAVPFHRVIMSMDAISLHFQQQVETLVIVFFKKVVLKKTESSPCFLHKGSIHCQKNYKFYIKVLYIAKGIVNLFSQELFTYNYDAIFVLLNFEFLQIEYSNSHK